MKIGLKNFRVFKDRMNFEIRPITVLTGPNNAGKSSLAKVFMLLQNGIYKLDYTKGDHKMRNSKDAVSYNSALDHFNVYFEHKIPYLGGVQLGGIFSEDTLSYIRISQGETILMEVGTDDYYNLDLKIFYKEVLDLFIRKEILVDTKFDGYYGKTVESQTLSDFLKIFKPDDSIGFHNYRSVTSPDYPEIEKEKITVRNIASLNEDIESANSERVTLQNPNPENYLSINALNTEIDKLNLFGTPYALFDVINRTEYITESIYGDIIGIQDKVMENFNLFQAGITDKEKALWSALEKIQSEIEKILSQKYPNTDLQIIPSVAYKILFSENFIGWIRPIEDGTTLIDELLFAEKQLQKIADNSVFTTIDRGLQFKSYDNPNYNLLLQYSKMESSGKGTFIRKSMEILGFPSEMILKQVDLINGIGIADLLLESGDSTHRLQDLGYGFSMLLPILIRIELGGSPIFIEEPEANLHPNYQSLLADIFVLATVMFPDVKIILETHSEYLLRKLQLLTATGKVPADKTMIYYFNADNNVSETNSKVVEIEINRNGRLSEAFGLGFYDEAVRLQFDLSNVNREQLN